jgi:hypothetical protein
MATKTSTVASHPLSLLVSLTCSCLSPACTHAFLLPEFQDTTRSMHRFNFLACITSSPSPHTHRCTQHACCVPSCPQQHAWYSHRWHMAQHVSWPAHPQVCCASLDVTCQPCVHITTMQHLFPVGASCLPWPASIPAVHSACTHLLHRLPARLPPTNPLLGRRR